jgi:hydroxymethylpyrimidine/phosphomethylpyrimidine kinase
MPRSRNKAASVPVALTIAGSDSGGGAGIQADLKTFASLGLHGTSALTCITAQNPKEVSAVQACRPDMVKAQIEAVFAELPPTAVKTGMLYSSAIIRTVADTLGQFRRLPLVVDPVMVSTSRASLLKNSALAALEKNLFPMAALVTPNLDEASVLIGGASISNVEKMRQAARRIQQRFGCAVLVKGGHLKGLKEAVDLFYDGKEEWLLSSPFIRNVTTHGTGCTYSAAITGYLAQGEDLRRSVQKAKLYITQAVAQSRCIGRHTVLNSFWVTA